MIYLRFSWGYDMIRKCLLLFWLLISTFEHEHDVFLMSTHLFPFTVLRFCFQHSGLNASLFSFFLKQVHFWITFFHLLWPKVRLSLTSAFSTLSYFSLAKIAKWLLQTPLFLMWILDWLVFSCCAIC